MKKIKLISHHKKIIADIITPVSIYLSIRDRFPNSILLENSDYRATDNSFSYICFNPIASISVKNDLIEQAFPDGSKTTIKITAGVNVAEEVEKFSASFQLDKPSEYKFISNGIFGYTAYDAVKYFEDIEIRKKEDGLDIPEIYYAVYQNIIAISNFKNVAYIFSNSIDKKDNTQEIHQLIKASSFSSFKFKTDGEISSNLTDKEYKQQVILAKQHCARGDVFQLVLSKRFKQGFKGDEFNVYRALRTINPSPYLFYFDFGDFKIFGSSPEAQLVVKDGKSEIHPIAGTFKRTGNDEQDALLAKKLAKDEKENAEHVMLVDLARNDLSRHCSQVSVEQYKEVQFFSHVIHLVSKVVGIKQQDSPTMQVVADTFPAGTLSGAPKHRAMQLIDKYEKTNRAFYGGAIGFMDFSGNFNHAIMIRTFLSQHHHLYWQAGAGLVSKSDPQKELEEVYNKLGALTIALSTAERI